VTDASEAPTYSFEQVNNACEEPADAFEALSNPFEAPRHPAEASRKSFEGLTNVSRRLQKKKAGAGTEQLTAQGGLPAAGRKLTPSQKYQAGAGAADAGGQRELSVTAKDLPVSRS